MKDNGSLVRSGNDRGETIVHQVYKLGSPSLSSILNLLLGPANWADLYELSMMPESNDIAPL